MPRRDTTTRRTGRRTALTPATADILIKSLRAGNHINTACHRAGVDVSTFGRWLIRAERADYAVEHGQEWDHGEQLFRTFRMAVLEARAHAAESHVDNIHRAAFGGQLVEEEPALDGTGNAIRDEDGRIVMKRRWTQPDGRLSLAYLKVAQPVEWGGSPSRMEVSGPGGGPVQVEGTEPDGDMVSRLASRVTAAIAERETERADAVEHGASGEGDVVVGEVVEE